MALAPLLSADSGDGEVDEALRLGVWQLTGRRRALRLGVGVARDGPDGAACNRPLQDAAGGYL